MSMDNIVGETIRKFRKDNGLTQYELAQKIGCDRTTIVKYENGQNTPNQGTIQKLGKVLGDEFIMSLPYQFRPFQYHDIDHISMIELEEEIAKAKETSLFMTNLLVNLCKKEGYSLKKEVPQRSSTIYILTKDDQTYRFRAREWRRFYERISEHIRIDFNDFVKERKDGGKKENHDQG